MVAVPGPDVLARRCLEEAEVGGDNALAALPDAGGELGQRAAAVGAGVGFGFEPLVVGQYSCTYEGSGDGGGAANRLEALGGVEGVPAAFDADDGFVVVEPLLTDGAFWSGG